LQKSDADVKGSDMKWMEQIDAGFVLIEETKGAINETV